MQYKYNLVNLTFFALLCFFALSVPNGSAEATTFVDDDYDGYSSPLSSNVNYTGTHSGYTIVDGAVSVTAQAQYNRYFYRSTTSGDDFSDNLGGYISLDFFPTNTGSDSYSVGTMYGWSSTNTTFPAELDFYVDFKQFYSSTGTGLIYAREGRGTPLTFALEEWHTLEIIIFDGDEGTAGLQCRVTIKVDSVEIDSPEDCFLDDSGQSKNNYFTYNTRPSQSTAKIGIDNLFIGSEAPPTGSTDPFSEITYSGDIDRSLEYYSPKPSTGYINEEINAVDITVQPNATFATYWFARYSDIIGTEADDLAIHICDSDFDNCVLDRTLDTVESFATTQSDNHLTIPFAVVDSVSEYYKISIIEYPATTKAQIAIKITGDVTSEYSSIEPYIPDTDTDKDFGFIGNTIRDLFLPDSAYITEKLNSINTIRVAKFPWYFQVKDELTGGVTTLSGAGTTAPAINLNIFGSGDVNVFDVSYIDGYMATFKGYISAFLWVAFGIFVVKASSNILKS